MMKDQDNTMLKILYSDRVQGYAAFANQHFSAGDVVLQLDASNISAVPSQKSIRVMEGVHATDKWGAYINHSFSPTTYVDKWIVRAIRDIHQGEEITFDYNKSEGSLAVPFTDKETCERVTGNRFLRY